MTCYTFTIPGIPRGQGRPRFARIGAHVRAYDPAESRNWKALVAMAAQAAGVQMIDGPVAILIVAHLPRPKRLMRKRDPEGPIPATCKPDADNILKGCLDALNGIAYADDAQVAAARVMKYYHGKADRPLTVVTVMGAAEAEGGDGA
jgi:Holliday junction resolvase RusA-like endonuclease